MKRIGLIVVCVALLQVGLSFQAFCSDDFTSKPKTTISTELYLLVNSVWNLNLETTLSERMTLELEGGYATVMGIDELNAYMGTINLHYYPNQSVSAPEGYWFGPGIGYISGSVASWDIGDGNSSDGYVVFKANTGYKFMLGEGKNFVIQPYGGLIYLRALYSENARATLESVGVSPDFFGFDFGLKIGFAF